MQNYKEIWKDVPGYEGHYQVSNLGSVRSLWFGKERVLRLLLNRGGYYYVGLQKGGARKANKVHRLVMIAFVGESDLDVNHKNGVKTDNRLENLEYCTRAENNQHAYDTGLRAGSKGEDHPNSKLTRACVERIKYGHHGATQQAISEIHGITRQLVSQIRSGRIWKHI